MAQHHNTNLTRLWPLMAALTLALPSTALAQAEPVALSGAEEGRLPEWCGVRPPMDFVLAYDEGKRFFLVEQRALQATEALLEASCPGDTVRLANFGFDIKWLGESVELGQPEARQKLLLSLKRRGALTASASINDNLVKGALKHWEGQLAEGAVPVLVVFTDTLESSAPRRVGMTDFDWTAVPDWFQGRFLTTVALLDHRSPREAPALYVTTAPPGMKVEDFSVGPRSTWNDLMTVFMPEPEPPPVPTKVVIRTVETTRAPAWLRWLGTVEGSLTAGGAVFTLLALIFLAGRLSRRRREHHKDLLANTIEGKHREVTLLLRDRLSGELLRQETRVLRAPLRVSPGSDADFVVPGPYAFEISDEGGETPVIRSTNMLGVELQRAAGRRVMVPEGDWLALRPDDRVDIGGGHEVEIQLG